VDCLSLCSNRRTISIMQPGRERPPQGAGARVRVPEVGAHVPAALSNAVSVGKYRRRIAVGVARVSVRKLPPRIG